MRIVVVGATGLIGRVVSKSLAESHEVVPVGHSSGDIRVDITDSNSIRALFQKIGPYDGLVSTAGGARFAPFDKLSDDDFAISLKDKLMGQVNLVRFGWAAIRDGGSFTLTSGVLASEPIPGSAAISLVNAGLNGFIKAAAIELPRGVRINIVSPPWAIETLRQLGMDESSGLPVSRFARAYREAVEGHDNGKVLDVRSLQ